MGLYELVIFHVCMQRNSGCSKLCVYSVLVNFDNEPRGNCPGWGRWALPRPLPCYVGMCNDLPLPRTATPTYSRYYWARRASSMDFWRPGNNECCNELIIETAAVVMELVLGVACAPLISERLVVVGIARLLQNAILATTVLIYVTAPSLAILFYFTGNIYLFLRLLLYRIEINCSLNI